MSERKERCETCRFWSKTDLGGDPAPGNSGECRRSYPTIVMAQTPACLLSTTTVRSAGAREGVEEEERRRIWPLTYAWDWCGEWQAIALPMVEEKPSPEVLATPFAPALKGWIRTTHLRTLAKAGAATVADLAKLSAAELLNHGLSYLDLDRIRDYLSALNLKLKGD